MLSYTDFGLIGINLINEKRGILIKLEYIRDLTDASKNGKLVFFVGAGLSTLSNYPQWGELVDKYYQGLHGKTKDDKYSYDEYLRIPQMFYDVKGEKEYDNILQEVFSVKKETNSVHDKLLALNPAHIITTNYDDLLERACWKRGRYFNVISSDQDVAAVSSSRYILKVHGDFRRGYEGKHIVLKESDYMNYEHNYPLVSNLMKTIMATHTVVFIGYGLGDYNINLILNWVKTLQKEGYNKPFFIRTDHQSLEENTKIYYEKRGLRIIDAASISNSSEREYSKRYNSVMDMLIESRENGLLSNDDEIIEYIYDKLSPLFNLSIRKIDLSVVFEYDYKFEVSGTIILDKNKGCRYLERFFELTEVVGNLSEASKLKYETIMAFFQSNNIFGMLESQPMSHYSFEIKNPAYHCNYEEMESFIQRPSDNLHDDYTKAFYLATLGEWEEAYNFYSDLLLRSIDESSWWIHYLSQINRYRLYQSIIQTAKRLSDFGPLVYRRQIEPFSEEFLDRINREMKNFQIKDVFQGMPYEFQRKYHILEFLSDNKFLYDDSVKLFELTNKVLSQISKGTYTFGLSAEYEVQFRLDDNIKFLYENCLWSSHFHEFKQYIRNSLILQLEKADFDLSRDHELDIFRILSSGFNINYYDFVNISKTFTVEDIQYIEKKCDIEQFEIRDHAKIEAYLVRLASELIKQLKKDNASIVFYDRIIQEIKSAFYFAKYIMMSNDNLKLILKVILFYIPERVMDMRERFIWTQRVTSGKGLSKEIISIIEEFLVFQANKHQDIIYPEELSNNYDPRNFVYLIYHSNNDYLSEYLSNYALNLSEDMMTQINFIFPAFPILSTEAKCHVLELKKVENIDDIIEGVQIGAIEKIDDYFEIITTYLKEQMQESLKCKEKGQKQIPLNAYIQTLGVYYFMGRISNIRMNDYLGFNDQYDLFVDPKSFDFGKFNFEWINHYSDNLLEKMLENQYIRPHLREVFKEQVKKLGDNRHMEILVNRFID